MGPFNNETGKYLEVEGFESGHWYANADGLLYIVPDVDAEIEGPDDDTFDKLNEVYRSKPFEEIDPYAIAATLGLELIPDQFKRFDDAVGYFSA